MIKVKTLTGKEIEIDIELTDTVERIKERVEEKEGIPPVQQRLIFAGKQMNDEKTAKEYNIEGGSVLHLVSRNESLLLSKAPRCETPHFWTDASVLFLFVFRELSRFSPCAAGADGLGGLRRAGGWLDLVLVSLSLCLLGFFGGSPAKKGMRESGVWARLQRRHHHL